MVSRQLRYASKQSYANMPVLIPLVVGFGSRKQHISLSLMVER